MEFTRNDMTFQGYTIPKVKANWNAMLLRKWEREAEEQSWIEHTELSGEDNDFLEVYPMQVTIFHKVRKTK